MIWQILMNSSEYENIMKGNRFSSRGVQSRVVMLAA